MLDEEVSFPTVFGEAIRIKVVRLASRAPDHERRVRALVAAHELRLGIEWNFLPIVSAAQRLRHLLYESDTLFRPRQPDPTLPTRAFFETLASDLELELELGRLEVVEGAMPLLGIPPEFELTEKQRVPGEPPPPPITRAPPPDKLTFFEVRFVDEIGQAIGGLEVELSAGSHTETLKTNPAGIVTLENVASMSANVKVVSIEALGEIVEPRWVTARVGSPPKGVNTKSFAFTGEPIAGVPLKPVVENTVVITPPFGKLFVELWEKTGRVRHVQQKYSIAGPASFSGETDAEGRLLHNEVPRGDYQLTLTVEIDVGNGELLTDSYTSPLVVLEMAEAAPQLRMLGALPRVVLARIRGLLFDTNKCFLLPTAVEGVQEIRKVYQANNPSELLIVGHTDTTAEPDINDPLSKERADSMKAYLEDDVDTWLANYDVEGKKQWGQHEDELMLAALPDFASKPSDEDAVRWFQTTRELEVDGVAGPQTRTQLITEYMALDGVKLSEEPGFQLSIKTHGAGENFPLDETGLELDQNAIDGQADPLDRRVELFFFDSEFGVLPEPAAADGEEYLEWRKRAAANDAAAVDIPVVGAKVEVTFVEFPDILFNHNSAVPCLDEDEDLIHGLSHAFLFAKENPDQEVLLVGHTDTSGEPKINYPLSELRARAVLAILTNDEAVWDSVTKERSKVEDYQRTLKTFATLYHWDCDPGEVDDKNGPKTKEAVEGFQHEANSIFDLNLVVDGVVGPKTWRAIFKIYRALLEEFGIELDQTFKLGNGGTGIYACGESFPIDRAENPDLRSETNRRVEVYFGKPSSIKPLEPPRSEDANLTKRECVLFDPDRAVKTLFGHRSILTVQRTDILGEPVAGVTARLFDASGAEVAPSQLTNKRGFVTWANLDGGEFDVRFE